MGPLESLTPLIFHEHPRISHVSVLRMNTEGHPHIWGKDFNMKYGGKQTSQKEEGERNSKKRDIRHRKYILEMFLRRQKRIVHS